ncbi:hypothetical protein VTN00DRAFT_4070 [Thermoascus crustaceus]|uniref:uncharacterized protein n=1 Tax=Thermoascus crustaceus TaxID=5088 RepID=UPI003742C85E
MVAPAAQLTSSPLRIMADPGGKDAKLPSSSPYNASARPGTESLPNLASPGLSSISDAPETSPRHIALPSDWHRKTSGFQHVHAPPIAPHASIQLPTCTHTTMTRQFDTEKDQTCDICHRKPFLGWLYVCTEDHGGFLPNDDDLLSSAESYQSRHPEATDQISLSPWISKAIERGHYTAQEIELLRLQKAKVRDAVAAARNPTPASTPSRLSDFSSIPEGPDDEAWTETVEDINDNSGDLDVEDDEADTAALPISDPLPPPCRLKCCHSCRPASRERSWASLNEICSEPSVKSPPAWDVLNRRVSDVHLIRKLGQLNVSSKRAGTPCSPEEDNARIRIFRRKRVGENGDSVDQTQAAATQPGEMERHGMESQYPSRQHGETTPEKRDSLSRTEKDKDAEASEIQHESGFQTTREITPKSRAPTPTQRGGIFLVKRKNRSLWAPPSDQRRTRPETMLQTAAGAAHTTIAQKQLPPTGKHQRPDSRSDDDEVGVSGGVALTEEGVTSGTRDIIMA